MVERWLIDELSILLKHSFGRDRRFGDELYASVSRFYAVCYMLYAI